MATAKMATAKETVRQIIDMLNRANMIPANFTGKINLEVNLSQGGVMAAEVGFREKIQ
jgi:hypothetical protein